MYRQGSVRRLGKAEGEGVLTRKGCPTEQMLQKCIFRRTRISKTPEICWLSLQLWQMLQAPRSYPLGTHHFFFVLTQGHFFIAFRERGREQERERETLIEKHPLVASSTCLDWGSYALGLGVTWAQTGDQTYNLGMCPDWESDPHKPFSYRIMLQPAEPCRPGWYSFLPVLLGSFGSTQDSARGLLSPQAQAEQRCQG